MFIPNLTQVDLDVQLLQELVEYELVERQSHSCYHLKWEVVQDHLENVEVSFEHLYIFLHLVFEHENFK